MTREEQLRFCKICKQKSFDPKKGIICSLTADRATFEDDCPDFISAQTLTGSSDQIQQREKPSKDTFQRFTELFSPTGGYFVTPVIFHINLLVFLAITISGAHFLFPSPEILITWGANYTLTVLEGEYWRLLSNTFLHYGLIHLTVNMITLLFAGSLLEKSIGSIRTLLAYLLTGISASAISFWWHDAIVSAGASGAIFGLFGVKIATLLTNPPNKEEKKRLLTTFLILVVYNLMGGFQPGIDQAAHTGGLLSGLIYGFAIYPPFIKSKWVRIVSESGIVLLLGTGIYFMVLSKPKDMLEFMRLSDQFAKAEHVALRLYRTSPDASAQSYLYTIRNTGIPNWNACNIILDKMDALEDVPPEMKTKVGILRKYVDLRIASYQTLFKAIAQNTNQYDEHLLSLTHQIDSIVLQVTGNAANTYNPEQDRIDKLIMEYNELIDNKPKREKININEVDEETLEEIKKNSPDDEIRIIEIVDE